MTREEVLTLLPEIKLIHSTDLQEKSITCWQQVLELGGWDKKGVDKAPLAAGIVADNCPETGIDHCRRVVRMCQLAYDELGGWANEISKLDHDTLICGAVLHDIGKFLEYDIKDGKASTARWASITTTWSAVRISPRATACPTRSYT